MNGCVNYRNCVWTRFNNLEMKRNVIPWNAKPCFRVWIFCECEFTDPTLLKDCLYFIEFLTRTIQSFRINISKVTSFSGSPDSEPCASIWRKMSIKLSSQSVIWPKTMCLPSKCGWGPVVMKNWDPLKSEPLLAIEKFLFRRPKLLEWNISWQETRKLEMIYQKISWIMLKVAQN